MWNTPQVVYKIPRPLPATCKGNDIAYRSLRDRALQAPLGPLWPSRCLAVVIHKQTLLIDEEHISYSVLRLVCLYFTRLDTFPEMVSYKREGLVSICSFSSLEPR